MSGARVVMTQAGDGRALELLGRECHVTVGDPAAVPDAEALLAFMPDRVDAALLDRCPRLRIVAGALKGADNVDLAACTERGVWVTVVPDLLSQPTAELALALLLAGARRLREADALVRSGRFDGWRPGLHGMQLAGTPAGVLGAGGVGGRVARMLAALGADVAVHDPAADPPEGVASLELEPLLARSRAVVAALPLTGGTRNLLDAERLALLPAAAVLVNVGRGSTVDEAAVAGALESGRLGAYAADVFAFEDLSLPDRPAAIHPALLRHPRTVLTPHVGSAVAEVRARIEEHAARSILQALAGQRPAGAVNRPAGAPATDRPAPAAQAWQPA